MQKLKLVLWIAILFILQTCLGLYIAVGEIAPELLFVFAIGYALHERNEKLRFIVPVICGALVDLTGGRIFGVSVLIYTLTALGGVWVTDLFYRTGMLFRFPLLFVLSMLGSTVYFLCNISVFGQMGNVFGKIIVPTACYNTVSAILIFPLIKRTWKQRR